jgi:hypothetical protein
MTKQPTPKPTAAKTKKVHSPCAAQTPCLPVHDLQGTLVFPMSTELMTVLGKERFDATCDDLQSREFTLICRSPEAIVYVHLSPIVVPMDSVRGNTSPTPKEPAAALRKAARKSATTK